VRASASSTTVCLRTASLAASSARARVAAHGRLRLRGLRLVRARLVAQPRHLARLRAATQPGRLRVGARELGLRLGTLGLESLELKRKSMLTLAWAPWLLTLIGLAELLSC
jgi:hypothetical protein